MTAWSETYYEHLSKLDGPVEVIRLAEVKVGSFILIFRGMGLTIYHGWFAKAERYVFLSSRKEMFQLADGLDAALRRAPSPVAEISHRELVSCPTNTRR